MTEGTEAFEKIGFSDEMIDELINLEEGESISNKNPKSKDLTYTTSTLVSTDWGCYFIYSISP